MGSSPLLQMEQVSKTFNVQGKTLHAVNDVSFNLYPGETLGLVGESGSGKSTIGRLALRLLEVDEGRVVFNGTDLTKMNAKNLRALRQNMQVIFQDAQASLNPRMTIAQSIEDPMIIHGIGSAKERDKRIDEVLERVGLPTAVRYAFPHELSGGQLQRVGIARALTLNPKMIVCDEPISALDVSIQVQVIQLLRELQEEMDLAYIFISHNLGVVEYLSQEVAVLYLGNVVEKAPAEELFKNPIHPYTKLLMESILSVPADSNQQREFSMVKGEMPSPFSPPSGCPFHPRCPLAMERCKSEKPLSQNVNETHQVACHLAD